MQNLEELKEKIFFESKNIIEMLAKINLVDELILKQNFVEELSQRVSFLKMLEKNMDFFVDTDPSEEVIDLRNNNSAPLSTQEIIVKNEEIIEQENYLETVLSDNYHHHKVSDEALDIQNIEILEGTQSFLDEEELIFIENENKIDEDIEESIQYFSSQQENTPETEKEKNEEAFEEKTIEEETVVYNVEEITDNESFINEEKEEETATNPSNEEQNRRKIIEIEKPYSERKLEEENEKTEQEKKIKLANIKALKPIQTLFDKDSVEKENNETTQQNTGSLLKTNIPTDFMEAEKPKQEFRLDLNDKIAFSSKLFGGSQSELNDVIRDLNSFKTLEEAKEYLSDVYYEKNWEKVDEYAQRLWALVENKFL